MSEEMEKQAQHGLLRSSFELFEYCIRILKSGTFRHTSVFIEK